MSDVTPIRSNSIALIDEASRVHDNSTSDSNNLPGFSSIISSRPSTNRTAAQIKWDRMVSGRPHLWTSEMGQARQRIHRILQTYNTYPLTDPSTCDDFFGPDARRALMADIFGLTVETVKTWPIDIVPPFRVNFGTNITFKGDFFANSDLIILDDAPVTFGARVLLGPRVGIYAATHSTNVDERAAGYERAYPIEIGDDCWIGGGAIINGPSKIGRGCTVAAGAVVRGDFPDYCVIAGVPGRIIKHLDPPSGPI